MPRDRIAEVGRATRYLIAQAGSARLTVADHRALLGVLATTASWSRLADDVSLSQVVAACGADRSDVRRSLRRLTELGLIEHVPGVAATKGQKGRPGRLALLPAPHNWVDPLDPGWAGRGSPDPRTADQGSPDPQGGGGGTPRVGVPGPPTEEFPEEFSEKTPPAPAPADTPTPACEQAKAGGADQSELSNRWDAIRPSGALGRRMTAALETDGKARSQMTEALTAATRAGLRDSELRRLHDKPTPLDAEGVRFPIAAFAKRISAAASQAAAKAAERAERQAQVAHLQFVDPPARELSDQTRSRVALSQRLRRELGLVNAAHLADRKSVV